LRGPSEAVISLQRTNLSDRKRVAVLTTGRQDYGILRSTLLQLNSDPRFELHLWAGGMHLSRAFGSTVDRIRQDGLIVEREIPMLGDVSDPVAESARTMAGVADAIRGVTPQALVLLGDRYEALAAGIAAVLSRVPIAHLHGGEETEGAIDNSLRHALTKLSHLHLVSHEAHAARVIQMGEPRESVVVVGAGGLDNMYRQDLPDRTALEERLDLRLDAPVVVVTLHPTTLGQAPELEARALTAAMERVPATYVITEPNSDPGAERIRHILREWAPQRPRTVLVKALGESNYWGLLRIASAVLGNSSSGLIEAPALGLPVVNVGDRQRGRLRSAHVIDVPPEAAAIEEALRGVLSVGARERYAVLPALFPKRPAAPRIVEALAQWRIPHRPCKKFVDRQGPVT
jgi:UDP-hydrolysing UDP-N-acetyl-D-glucosamine 2-epimerase